MKGRLISLIACCLIAWKCEQPLEAPEGYYNGTIEGKVYYDPDNDGQFEPAPLAKVKLDEHPLLPDTKPKTLTDSWGYFKFEDVEPGEHVIWGSKEGQGSAYYIGKRKVYLEKRGNAYVELKLHAWP